MSFTCAKCGHLNEQPKMVLDPKPDPSDWPDWYGDLLKIKGFDEPPAKVNAWLAKNGISVAVANEAASALRAKWGNMKYKEPWPAFRNWAQRPSRNGHRPVARGIDGFSEKEQW
jgi:hypothetical protein